MGIPIVVGETKILEKPQIYPVGGKGWNNRYTVKLKVTLNSVDYVNRKSNITVVFTGGDYAHNGYYGYRGFVRASIWVDKSWYVQNIDCTAMRQNQDTVIYSFTTDVQHDLTSGELELKLKVSSVTSINADEWVIGNYETPAEWVLDMPVVAQETLSFDSDGGSEEASQVVRYGEEYNLPTPTRPGYDFLGWYDGADKIVSGDIITKTQDFTLKAHWKVKSILYVYIGGERKTCVLKYKVSGEWKFGIIKKKFTDGWHINS